MNKEGFVSPIGIFLGYLVFLGVWWVALAEPINYWVQYTIEFNSLTGIEAFLVANMNLWIFLIATLAVVAGAYMGGGE